MQYHPPSLESEGVKLWLDSTKSKHNDLGFKEFKLFLKTKVNITNIARAFGVSRPTAVNWLETYNRQQQAKELQKGEI